MGFKHYLSHKNKEKGNISNNRHLLKIFYYFLIIVHIQIICSLLIVIFIIKKIYKFNYSYIIYFMNQGGNSSAEKSKTTEQNRSFINNIGENHSEISKSKSKTDSYIK